jgi:Fusaric acid resistance protein family
MSGATHQFAKRPLRFRMTAEAWSLPEALRTTWPPLMFGLRLWASVSLALYAAFWLQLDNPFWAGASAAIVCQPQLGASLRKGWFRMLGTLAGAIMSVVLVACFAQDRILFLAGLALWGAACSLVAVLLRNFASYAASLAGYTAAIIAGDLLGSVGGVDANAAFLLAVTRSTEICLGIVCAGVVLAATDLGGARRRLASLFAELAADITAGLNRTLAMPTSEFSDGQVVRCQFLRRLIAFDPIIDQALGESSEIRYHLPVLQRAVDGLFSALAAWDVAANHLATLPHIEAQQEASTILESVPSALRSPPEQAAMPGRLAVPSMLHRMWMTAAVRWTTVPGSTPSLQLLADKTAEAFAGIEHAFDGVALLIGGSGPPVPRGGRNSLPVPDWLPPLVSAARTFAAIGAVGLFWIVTGWPGGSLAIAFAAIVALLLAPRSDETYGAALLFTVGAALDLILTAIVAFAVLPALRSDDFTGFCLVIGACLVPIGALLRQARQPWQAGLFTAMTMGFVPILQPTNPETYDTLFFYNIALPIVAGMGIAALSFRLLPPLSPAYRTRRLLALTLRDLRRLAIGRSQPDWEGHVYGRLTAMPGQATPLQRAQVLAALSAGSEVIHLQRIARRVGLGLKLDAVLAAIAGGHSAQAIVQLSRLDDVLAADAADGPGTAAVLSTRASILVLAEALTKHGAYFDAGARP